MTGDDVFPIPEPTWLWVHQLSISHTAGAASVIDSEGRWEYHNPEYDTIMGYLTGANPEEIERAAQQGIRFNAVALVPRETVVQAGDELIATNTNTLLDGTYRISQVRPNLSHLRLMIDRIPEPDPWPDVAP